MISVPYQEANVKEKIEAMFSGVHVSLLLHLIIVVLTYSSGCCCINNQIVGFNVRAVAVFSSQEQR